MHNSRKGQLKYSDCLLKLPQLPQCFLQTDRQIELVEEQLPEIALTQISCQQATYGQKKNKKNDVILYQVQLLTLINVRM